MTHFFYEFVHRCPEIFLGRLEGSLTHSRTHTHTCTCHHTIIKIVPSGTKIVFGDVAAKGSGTSSGGMQSNSGRGGGGGGGGKGGSAAAPNVHPSWAAKMVTARETSHIRVQPWLFLCFMQLRLTSSCRPSPCDSMHRRSGRRSRLRRKGQRRPSMPIVTKTRVSMRPKTPHGSATATGEAPGNRLRGLLELTQSRPAVLSCRWKFR